MAPQVSEEIAKARSALTLGAHPATNRGAQCGAPFLGRIREEVLQRAPQERTQELVLEQVVAFLARSVKERIVQMMVKLF